LIELCIADCVRTGMLRADDKVMVRRQVDMPYAYVVYDHARKRNVELIQTWLEKRDIILAGRYAQWQYYNSDHAFIAGKEAAERAQCRQVEECGSLHSIIA
jgi:protoporphyrinogen oxidase